ncbi:SidA/IucD/PvdA family monooxygenase [Gracilibacillus caseinilyticus]|uniref:L-lysine N6-monooxygenase MbtG n=1 Tax=Gracilibacillus caseinilyticus TaxID=2932256 RepID=A0ABY4ETQ3_9BACI|nr:SidA/IucD/PvdA family monooxygenase [Gracilibacillus caseinilyticus]UOQ47009.1 SidA/IucD/PvdA family monooxygenase [Gracilibacillus caseinilyticus]
MEQYDVIGIGLGPYNLGLATLTTERSDLKTIFFDQNGEFAWHPGMLINGTDLQVSFLADLVTLANPTSKYTFLNYLHEQNRLYKFFFFHKFEMPRKEYADYLKWVANQLPTCNFQSEIIDVIDHGDHFEVVVNHWGLQQTKSYYAKHVVMGTGGEPVIPVDLDQTESEKAFHSSQYLYHKDHTIKAKHITVVGSGQSASEIFYDLLKLQEHFDYHLSWYTRSPGFLQLDNSKLGQEVFTPDYVDYFHNLSYKERVDSLEHLGQLRKGIDGETLHKIHELLYHRSVGNKKLPITIQPLTEIQHAENEGFGVKVKANQWQKDEKFTFSTEKLILATGYKPNIPDWFYKRFGDKVIWEDDKRYKVNQQFKLAFKDDNQRDHHFYTLTNLEHSHGTGATNLGLAVDRNIQIINEIAGKTIYPEQRDTTFTEFNPANY